MVPEIEDIILAKLNGEVLSEEEERLFAEWYGQSNNRKRYYEWGKLQSAVYANAHSSEIHPETAWQKVNPQKYPAVFLHRLVRYAAVILLFIGAGVATYWLNMPQPTMQVTGNVVIEPGKKQATLTLSNGEQIVLTDTNIRIGSREKGVIIQNNQHILEYNSSAATTQLAYNTIDIPRGGEYVLALADGTKIWLNSESRITYPVTFPGKTREINLEGEAYFEIAKDATKPFIVHTKEFNVRVTGTQFNVRTYPEEASSTTLTEGRIQLEKTGHVNQLLPGQQAIVHNDSIEIKEVDTEEAIAWRHEAFCFKQRTLESILNELSRWYDIAIFYQNPEVRNYHFSAWFKRSSSIEEVIQILEKTKKIKTQLSGKTLTVKINPGN